VLRERPDVVIADLMMPSINGLELTRRIKQERPQTKVILMGAIHCVVRRKLQTRGGDSSSCHTT
jgi:DNA-binding response OmpR family regulator